MKKDYTTEREEAFKLYQQGIKYKEIADRVGVTLSAVKSWATRYWKQEKVATTDAIKVATKKRKKGGQPGNKNATGPPGNKNAEKHGFFSKWLPEEVNEIVGEMPDNYIDALWDNIQLQYASIIRAQKLMYVKNQQDKTIEKVEEKSGNVIGERWEVQQAWDKQATFMTAQSRAMKTLEGMISKYDELIHKDWDSISDEQKSRIKLLKAQCDKITGDDQDVEDTSETDEIIYGDH